MKTSPKGFSASKCELDFFKILVILCESVWKFLGFCLEIAVEFSNFFGIFLKFLGNFSEGFFWRNHLAEFFDRNFFGGFFLEDFFGGFSGGFFWEDFFGGPLLEEFFVYIGIDLFVKILG